MLDPSFPIGKATSLDNKKSIEYKGGNHSKTNLSCRNPRFSLGRTGLTGRMDRSDRRHGRFSRTGLTGGVLAEKVKVGVVGTIG